MKTYYDLIAESNTQEKTIEITKKYTVYDIYKVKNNKAEWNDQADSDTLELAADILYDNKEGEK